MEATSERSLEFYRAAVTTDPGYALAWAGLASAWNRMVDWDIVPVVKARPEGLATATKAVALDPQLADAQHALGVAKLLYNRDWAGAEQALQKAVELDPMDGDHRWEYARLILVPPGRFGESADLMRKAIALEPWKVALHDQLANSLVRGRQYEAALQAVESARRVSPKAPSPIIVEGIAAASQGRYEEALRLFEEAAKFRRSPWVLAHLGFTCAKLGRADQARAAMAELEKGAKDGSLPEFELAVIHAALGEKEQAVTGLERSIAGYAHSALWMNVDYRLEDLRDHPRYPGLLRAVGLSR
jgi:tetratricopeptide (TPR) repeat protein